MDIEIETEIVREREFKDRFPPRKSLIIHFSEVAVLETAF